MQIDTQVTPSQKNALHLWFRRCTAELNRQGISQELVIDALNKHGLDVPWTEGAFKECVWKPVAKAMTGQESTQKAGRSDYSAEYEGLCKFFIMKVGVILPPFPEKEKDE